MIENDVTPPRNTCRQDFSFFNLKKGLHITSLNIQHLLPKLDEIKLHLGLSNPSDILGLSETFLTNQIYFIIIII